MEMKGKCQKLVADVLVEQVVRTQADGDKQQRLQELVGRNQHEPFIVLTALSGDVQ
jgi:hypothetical protein